MVQNSSHENSEHVWTISDNSYLVKLVRQRTPISVIALRMNLSIAQVEAQLAHIDNALRVDYQPFAIMAGTMLAATNDYNELGNGLRAIAEILSNEITLEELTTQITSEIPNSSCLKIDVQSIARKLLANYVICKVPVTLHVRSAEMQVPNIEEQKEASGGGQ